VNIYTLIHMHVVNKCFFTMKRKAGRGRRPRPGPRPAGPRPDPQRQGPGAAAGPAPVPSAGGSRRTGPALLGASFIYALLSKNDLKRGFLRFSKSIKSMKCCRVLATKRV